MRINLRRGLLRLWLVLAVLWATLVGIFSFGDVRDEFEKAAGMKKIDALRFILEIPVDCNLVRGTNFRRERNFCWYDLAAFRELYPEYKDLNDTELSVSLYQKAGIPLLPIRPWSIMGERACLAVGPPIAILAIGWALTWALAGFSERAETAE